MNDDKPLIRVSYDGVKVYNFEVQDFHTYYVGKNSVLVHNDCETKDLYRAVGVEEFTIN